MAHAAKAKRDDQPGTAASEAAQAIRRRNEAFITATEAGTKKSLNAAKSDKRETFVSAWEALRGPADGLLNEEEYAVFSSAWTRE